MKEPPTSNKANEVAQDKKQQEVEAPIPISNDDGEHYVTSENYN